MSAPAATLLALSLALTFTAPVHALTADEAEARGAAAIRREALLVTDAWLAAPARGGRLAGSPGYRQAAHEMARRFASAGLSPGGDRGWFQHVDVEENDVRACALEVADADGTWRTLRHGPDYTVRGLSGSGRVEAPVVFAGYGMTWPERGYDDYAGLDARGAVVLVIKENPPFSVDSSGWGDRALTRPRARAAAAHGARALLVVPSPLAAHPQAPIASMLEGPGPQDSGFPALQVAAAVGESLVARTGARLGALQSAIDSTHAPHSRSLPVRVRLRVDARYHAAAPSMNVVGVLPGSDPALRGQCVVIGAHLDHVGTQAGLVFRGANDNASGASTVLEVARAFHAAGVAPRRTVVFALFTSEECALQGSRRFVERPPVPRDSIVAYLNVDCVGVGDSLQVGGGGTWKRLWRTARDADGREAHRMLEATWPGGGADATAFAEHGIPCAYFASHPSYTWLHLPGDTPQTLEPGLLEAIARTVFRTAWVLAQGAPVRD